MNHDPAFLFELRVQPYRREHDSRKIIIRAFDKPSHPAMNSTGHSYIDVEVRHGGKVIFPRGQLWCGVNAWTSTDGMAARDLVMSLVAMHPSAGGGEGDDYYRDYTEAQLQWAETYGEALDCERSDRYCDPETGDVRS